jgi:hypothetical protein
MSRKYVFIAMWEVEGISGQHSPSGFMVVEMLTKQ